MFFQLIILIFITFPFSLSLNQEGHLLYQVKLSFEDPDNSLSNWNTNDDTPCNWHGVLCDPKRGSVTTLDLSGRNLLGPFPGSLLCRLHNLTYISFYNNNINSTLLENEMGACDSLTYLSLAQNLLTGKLPDTLADLKNLKYLDLAANNFSGRIPASFGRFRQLEVLGLVANLFEGRIPGELGNITSLKQLNLSYNPFSSPAMVHEAPFHDPSWKGFCANKPTRRD